MTTSESSIPTGDAISTAGWTIRRARPADAAALADFGRRAFEETFGHLNRPEDTAEYLEASFGEAIQRSEIAQSNAIMLLLEASATLLGYAFVDTAAPDIALDAPVRLHRLYLDGSLHGSGAGGALLAAAVDAGRELRGGTLWLSVWDRNPRAIAFYRKSGFDVVGSAVFVVGADRQSDLIMALPLAGASMASRTGE